MDNFNALVSGVPAARGPGERRLDRPDRQAARRHPRGTQRATSRPTASPARSSWPTSRRWRRSARAWRRSSKDPATAEALKPYYRQFCKRPCFHNEYLETFNRPNVTLVDTHGKGVERITEKGVVVDGREYELDCLIYATGFEVGTDYSRRAGFEIHGRDGESLSETWAGGVRTLHGMHVHGFPNCFIMSNPQAGFTASYPHMLNEQAKHLAYIIRTGIDAECAAIEVTPEAEAGWVDQCIAKARNVGDFFENCTPGYYNNEGKTRRAQRAGRLLRRRLDRVHPDPRGLARRRRARRPGTPLGSRPATQGGPMSPRLHLAAVSALAIALAVLHAAPAARAAETAHEATPATAIARTPRPADARLYIISPQNGETVTSPVTVRFGLAGMGVAPAGVATPNTGHHHLIVDSPAAAVRRSRSRRTSKHLHFGGGQTETVLALAPGAHTLQLVLGDKDHVPHEPPLVSETVTITVKYRLRSARRSPRGRSGSGSGSRSRAAARSSSACWRRRDARRAHPDSFAVTRRRLRHTQLRRDPAQHHRLVARLVVDAEIARRERARRRARASTRCASAPAASSRWMRLPKRGAPRTNRRATAAHALDSRVRPGP